MADPPTIAEGLFSFQFGGSERVGVDLALEFKRRGFNVVCFAFHGSDGPFREQLEAAGVRCLDMNYDRYRGPWKRLLYLWNFHRMLRRERITALHVHHAGALILCGIPARLAGVRHVVMTEHDLAAFHERPDARRLAIAYCPYASEITVVEPKQADYFRENFRVPPEKLHYLPNGVRIMPRMETRRAAMRQELEIPTGVFAYFFVGRLSAVKDLGTLLEAFARLPAEIVGHTRLLLVGDGPERGKLEARRDQLGLGERVRFLGARHDAAQLLGAADALVMSSKSEGLPMVLLEAMAAGVPCIATAVGGIAELFGEDRGLLVAPQQPQQLADAMARLAGSPALRAQLAEQALTAVRRKYDFEPIADGYLRLLGLASKPLNR